MPNYKHECKKCQHAWDDFLWISQLKKPIECPKCKYLGHHRVISAGASIINTDSHMDSFSYRVGYKLEKAKELRKRAAEHAEAHGRSVTPYIDEEPGEILHEEATPVDNSIE